MNYPNAKRHEFFGVRGEPGFCDMCCFPACEHRIEKHEVVKSWVNNAKNTLGRIVKRRKDGKFFFEIWEWMAVGWHPLTVGYQDGLFASAQDRYESWKRMQEVWQSADQGRLYAAESTRQEVSC